MSDAHEVQLMNNENSASSEVLKLNYEKFETGELSCIPCWLQKLADLQYILSINGDNF